MPPTNGSFIPKSGVKTVQRTRGARRIYVLAYISYIVFFSTLFAVIGVYVYGVTVSRSLTSLKDQLIAERQRFSVTDIESVKMLDKRLSTAQQLLQESSAPSRLFTDIESIVASNIYFSAMSYRQLPNRQFSIELTGRANNFSDIIGQRNLLGSSALLQDATVVKYDYSVGAGTGGSVLGAATLSFIFSDTRDLSAIAYAPGNASVSSVVDISTPVDEVVIEGTSSPAVDISTSTTATSTESTAPPVAAPVN